MWTINFNDTFGNRTRGLKTCSTVPQRMRQSSHNVNGYENCKLACYRWIKRDQLDVTCFIISLFTAQHVSDVNTSIIRSLRLICWVISWVVLLWFDVCWCYVVVWYPYAGWSTTLNTYTHTHTYRLKPASGYHTTPAKPHRNTNTYRTRAIQPMK